jgi:voltage-gated potassium channel
MNEVGSTKHEEIGFFQVVILILSVIVLGALVLDTAFKLPANITEILQTLDTIVCLVLLLDFGIRLYKAESKLGFLKWGWIDLVASIPNLPVLRIGRLVRILRVIRLFRALRTTHKITTLLLKDKLQTGFASIALTFFLLIMFSSIGILICEQQVPGANIKTADDAIWWSVTTITTVGYGDKYPVTPEGRYLAMGLMIAGVGFFGASSGLVASSFIGSKQKGLANDEEILSRLKKLDEKIDALVREKGDPKGE